MTRVWRERQLRNFFIRENYNEAKMQAVFDQYEATFDSYELDTNWIKKLEYDKGEQRSEL